jgi:hypothetical protein
MCNICGRRSKTPVCDRCRAIALLISELKNNMGKDKINIDVVFKALRIRLKLCDRILTTTNMVLAYQNMEEIYLYSYQTAKITPNEELLVKFDKIKNLALGNKNVNERKVAFNRSVAIMDKMLNGEILNGR